MKLDERGFVQVDPQRMTNVQGIYAVGDLAGQPMLAHKATHEGRVAVEHIADADLPKNFAFKCHRCAAA